MVKRKDRWLRFLFWLGPACTTNVIAEVSAKDAEMERAACGGGPACFTCSTWLRPRVELERFWSMFGDRFIWRRSSWTEYR